MKYQTTLIYYRLIALWVLCEAMLGGIIHGLKLPVSGLIVGGGAVICICLIAWYVPVRNSIIKATVIVAIFKMMLSPQAPFPAYFAVFFQGLLGELLFINRKFFRLSCILLAVLAMLESGLQRILVLTIIYGNDLWRVVNDFINGLTKQKNFTNYSLLVGCVYVFIHVVTGFFVGILASILPGRIEKWSSDNQYRLKASVTENTVGVVRKPRRFKPGLIIIWIILVALYVQSYFNIGKPLLPSHISLKILLRSLIIVLGWILIAGPLLNAGLHTWLKKKQSESGREIQQILELLPSVQQLAKQSWQQAGEHGPRKKWSLFFKIVLVNIFYPEEKKETRGSIFILTAPTGSGKTSSLLNWIKNRTDAYGIVTPIIEGQRVFMNVHTGETFSMEAKGGETEVLVVGRYIFSKAGFDKASQLIENNIEKNGWLVIDELGPLELEGKGFHDIVEIVLSGRTENILLVIRDRDDMVKKMQQAFQMPTAILIKDISELDDITE